jgi:hypothetical protein
LQIPVTENLSDLIEDYVVQLSERKKANSVPLNSISLSAYSATIMHIMSDIVPSLQSRINRIAGFYVHHFPCLSLTLKIRKIMVEISGIDPSIEKKRKEDQMRSTQVLNALPEIENDEIRSADKFVLVRLWKRLSDPSLDGNISDLLPSNDVCEFVEATIKLKSPDPDTTLVAAFEYLSTASFPENRIVCCGVLSQFVLDVYYILTTVSSKILPKPSRRIAEEVCKRLLKAYLDAPGPANGGQKRELQPSDWYMQRIKQVKQQQQQKQQDSKTNQEVSSSQNKSAAP